MKYEKNYKKKYFFILKNNFYNKNSKKKKYKKTITVPKNTKNAMRIHRNFSTMMCSPC